jgi:poly(3-hydroxyoctanoate) depolymerase
MVPGSLGTLLEIATPASVPRPAHFREVAGELYGGRARCDPDAAARPEQPTEGVSRVGYLLQQLALLGWSSHPRLPMLAKPTLILAGDDDPIVPLVNAKLMAQLIPRACT